MAETHTKRPRSNAPDRDTHGGPAPKRPAVRKRAPLACEECRMRKRRCDGAVPICGGCTKRMSSCVYLADLQEKAWHQDMIQSLRTRLKELEQSTLSPPAEDASATINVATNTATETEVQANSEPSATEDAVSVRHFNLPPDTASVQSVRLSQTEGATSVASPTPTSDTHVSFASHYQLLPTAIGDLPAPLVNASTPYGSPSGVSVSGQLEPSSVERLMRPIDRAISKTAMRPTPAVGTATSIASTQCCCGRLLGGGQWSLPLRRQADDLVHLYFSRVHRMYPILHQPTFMRQYKLLWEPAPSGSVDCSGLCKQKSLDKTFPAMVNAVFALASLFASRPLEQNSAKAVTFFDMTQRLDLLDIIDQEVGIELVQLLLLMGFYLQSTEKFSKCWNITGLAIRMAQNMGLQLGPNEARRKGLLTSCSSQLESEMRVRVWYGCILLDREISMSFGRPLMINTGAADQLRLPEAIDDEHLSEEIGEKCNAQPANCPSMLESYIQTIKLYDILGQVLDREESNDANKTSYSNADTQSLLDLDTMIMEWRDSLPPHLQYDPSSEGSREDHGLSPSGAVVTDFSAQAKRLHARFLHVRVLILRPALEHLFQRQRATQPSSNPRCSPRVARVQDLTLSEIAAQCVLSADSLVRCLDAHIKSQSLVAWWYNIGYLHTCGSTLLMGRMCSFSNAVVRRESLAQSLDLCLQSLSQYTALSSIALKSVNLLQESTKRLLPDRAAKDQPLPAAYSVPTQATGQSAYAHTTSLMANVVEGIPQMHLQPSFALEPCHQPTGPLSGVDPVLAGNSLGDPFEAELWAANDSGTSYWPFMPFLSQLESLPQDFGIASLE
ncbi:hypothetical protein OQA88_1024 [Cercophora sp. LCS_1]